MRMLPGHGEMTAAIASNTGEEWARHRMSAIPFSLALTQIKQARTLLIQKEVGGLGGIF